MHIGMAAGNKSYSYRRMHGIYSVFLCKFKGSRKKGLNKREVFAGSLLVGRQR